MMSTAAPAAQNPGGLDPALVMALAVLGAAAGAAALHALVAWGIRRLTRRRGTRTAQLLADHARGPGLAVFVLAAVHGTLLALREPERLLEPARHASALALIAAVAWLLMRLALATDLGIEEYIDTARRDELPARRLRTRVRVLRRVVVVLVWVVAASSMLMTFPRAWQLGLSLLASAGIVGLAAGLAARPVLGNLIAGVQIAVTEPIRLGDAVTIEGQFGWVEEITATYVVLLTRERRRLIVPVTFFVERMFENWTRAGDGVGAAVVVSVPRGVDLGALREAVGRALEATAAWDRRDWTMEVTAVRAMEMDVRIA